MQMQKQWTFAEFYNRPYEAYNQHVQNREILPTCRRILQHIQQ